MFLGVTLVSVWLCDGEENNAAFPLFMVPLLSGWESFPKGEETLDKGTSEILGVRINGVI